MATKDADYIDILQLIHDIYITSKSRSKLRKYLDAIELTNTRLIFNSHIDLIQFIKEIANLRKKQHIPPGLDEKNNNNKTLRDNPINWLSVFYNRQFVDIWQRLSIISAILTLYRENKNIDIDIHFDAIKIIRKCIPHSSHIRGIENNNYLSLNVEELFGEFQVLNIDHLSIDLCKQIASYLDLPTFFKCSSINHCWLNFIYRNDSFYTILKQCTSPNAMRCVIVDHSSLNRMESIYLSKIFINWQIRSESKYLDFVTLQKSWIVQYIDVSALTLTLQEFKQTDEWIDVKSVETNTKHSKKLFDSMDVFDVKNDDEKSNTSKPPVYRLQIHIKSPFEWIFYTEARNLNPFNWHTKYHANDVGIATEQQFWFEYYLELLYSMIDTDISQALATIMEAAQRLRFDHQFVTDKLSNVCTMTQIIRLLQHKDWRIQHNAAILLANLFATNEYEIREKYLTLCTFATQYNVIHVTMDAIYNLLHKRAELVEEEYRVCRSLICVVGNYVISKDKAHQNTVQDKWKKLALTHNINYIPFMIKVLNKEAIFIQKAESAPINVWSFRAMSIWSLSTFYRYKSVDDTVNKILNHELTRKVLHLFFDWTVIVGYEYLSNRTKMNKKMDKFLNKRHKTQPEFDKQQKCFSTVLAESCIGIQRVFSSKYQTLSHVLDMSIARKITLNVLDICIKGIDSDWAQYLTHLALKLIAQTLRFDAVLFVAEYIELKLANKLYDILQIIKKTLPNEKGLVSSFKNWIRTKTHEPNNNDTREIQKINSFIELYDDVIDIINSVTKHKEFAFLAQLILDVLCIYSQRDKCEEQYLQHVIAYLWNSLTQNPIKYKKIILKHKSFMKVLKIWSANSKRYGVVFNGVVSNICCVLKDNNLFKRTFSVEMNDENDEKNDGIINDMDADDCYCPCGQRLQLLAAKDCYDNSSWLYCDLCFQKIAGERKVFHCDRKQPEHENGYDLCITCAKRRALIHSSKSN